jgi:hypothetical protein
MVASWLAERKLRDVFMNAPFELKVALLSAARIDG